jgi:hypothetical protein
MSVYGHISSPRLHRPTYREDTQAKRPCYIAFPKHKTLQAAVVLSIDYVNGSNWVIRVERTLDKAQKNHLARVWLALSACSACNLCEWMGCIAKTFKTYFWLVFDKVSAIWDTATVITHGGWT